MPKLTPPWQKRRSAFNHDWLKNRYMPALAKYLNLLEGRVEDEEFERSFVSNILPEWEEHRGEALALAVDFERDMSPRLLFESRPLSRCDEATRLWLGDLLHALWLRRHPVRRWVEAAEAATARADEAYTWLRDTLRDCPAPGSADATRRYLKQFAELRARCQDVANAVSKFPSEVKVS